MDARYKISVMVGTEIVSGQQTMSGAWQFLPSEFEGFVKKTKHPEVIGNGMHHDPFLRLGWDRKLDEEKFATFMWFADEYNKKFHGGLNDPSVMRIQSINDSPENRQKSRLDPKRLY